MSKQEPRYIAIMGNMGTGKSTFISKHLSASSGDLPAISDDGIYVTKRQKLYPDENKEYIFLDTVGLDELNHDGGLNSKVLEGKLVAYDILLSSFRWQSQRHDFCIKLGWKEDAIPSNANFFAAHNAAFKPTPVNSKIVDGINPPQSINDLIKLGTLRFVRQTYVQDVQQAPSPPLKIEQKSQPISLSKESKENKAHESHEDTMARQLFKTNFAKLNARQNRLYQLLSRGNFFKITNQLPMSSAMWQSIKSATDVIKRKDKGDCSLRYFLFHIYDTEPVSKAIEKCNNDSLTEVLCRQDGLEAHVKSLYDNHHLNNESLGNYMEALFEKILEGDPKYIVDFLRHVLNPLPDEPKL